MTSPAGPGNPVRYTVEQVEQDLAREDLIRIWRDNLPVADSCDRKFAWTYERAPTPPLSPVMLTARRGDERTVVGAAGVTRRVFIVDGEPAWAGLFADVAVDRNHRKALPALALIRRAREAARERAAFVYGSPNRKAEPVFVRAGYTRLGSLTRYVRVLRHAGYARRIVNLPLIAGAVGRVADAGVFVRRVPDLVAATARYRLTFTDATDERAAEVWEAAAPRYRIVGRRNAEFLRWRLADYPYARHRFAWLEARGGGARAYAAVSEEDGDLAVRDFFGPPEMLPPLFEKLAVWARARGARSIALRFLGDPRVVAALHASGFHARDHRRAIVIEAFESSTRYALLEPANWYLTDADEDI